MSERYSVHNNKEEQFTKAYNECFRFVYAFVFARCAGNRQMTEEIVQETFSAAWQAQERFNEKSSYKTWLCGIAKNKLRLHYRKRIAIEKYETGKAESIEDAVSAFDVEDIIINDETIRAVQNALMKIKAVYRYALVMKYIDDYSVKQIAKELHKTPKAVDGILQRAKNSFQKVYRKNLERESIHE